MDEPDFENMSKEEVDQMLIAYGYDPEMVARTGRFVAQVGIENVKLKSEIDRLQAERDALRACVEAVEWIEFHNWSNPTKPKEECPWCGSMKWTGHHAPDCQRQQSLMIAD